MSRYTRNLSLCFLLRPPYKYPKISQIRLSSDPSNFKICWSIKLKPQRCTSAIYIHSLCEVLEIPSNAVLGSTRMALTNEGPMNCVTLSLYCNFGPPLPAFPMTTSFNGYLYIEIGSHDMP